MAKFKIKGKKVTGTKKKDKIVWQKSWKKNLTVDALKGNDTIDFTKSKKTNTFIGGKGNDIIKTGKGTSTIVINKGDGNDTIYHNSKKTTIKVNKAKANDKQVFERKGNDLILSYTHGGTTTKEVLTFKDYYKGNKNIYLGKKKLETLISSKGMTITSSGNIQGTNGNDTIYGSKGNDTINAGKGNNTIFLKKNEGTDTIQNGGGNDTLVFSQESNFDNFTFTNSGDDLNIKAGGTTAVLKGFNAGKSSIKTVKAGNLSFGKIIKRGESYTIEGTSGNDLFLLSDTDEHDIKTGAGNDIVYIEDGYYDEIYASIGNNYIDMKECYDETIYLKDMTGNNTVVSDWYGYFNLDFTENETSSAKNGDEMVKTLQLAEGDGTYKYVLGKRSGNDLVLSTVNNKTVTIKDFYVGSGGYFYVEDESGSVELDHGSDNNIYSMAPGYIKLTGNDNISSAQNKYIYGRENIAYNVTINSASGNNMEIYGTGNKTVNIAAGNSNSISMYSDWDSTTGVCTANITGSKNSIYASTTLEGSSYSLTGNNNYLSLYMVRSATINLNGTGNYASVSINNNQQGNTMNITTQGQNEVSLSNEYTGWYQAGNTVFNITTKGNDKFYVGGTQYENSVDFNCTGSNGTNKNIGIGVGNNLKIIGALETGKVDLDLYYSTMKNVITHYNGDDFIYFEDLNPNKMKFRRYDEDYYNGSIRINGAAGQGAADLNSTAFLNKFRVSLSSDAEGVYHTLNEFEQYFDTNHETIAHNFTFGSANMGYMSNLTSNYLVHGTGNTTNDTYSNYTFASGRHSIYDAGGSADTLTIGENNNNIKMYFNIASDGSIYGSSLSFLKASEFQNFMKGTEVANGLSIMNYFGGGQIENIQAGESHLAESKLSSTVDGSLIAEVVSWMSGKGYADTNAVISTGSDADKTALYTIYNNHNATDGYWVVTLSV